MGNHAVECLLIERRVYRTQAEARMAVFQFIEGWRNTRCPHSGLGYLSPDDFERAAAAAVARPEGDGVATGKIDLEVFSIGRVSGPRPRSGSYLILRSWRRLYFHRLSRTSVLVPTALNCP